MSTSLPAAPGAAATFLWAMDVAERWRGRGVGSRLVSVLARRSIAAERTVLWADARGDAVGFYVACGALVLGDPYRDSITGLQDRRIVIDLESDPGQPSPAAGWFPDAYLPAPVTQNPEKPQAGGNVEGRMLV